MPLEITEDVDHRVSISLHPKTLTALDGYGEDSAKFIVDADSAFRAAYHVIGKIHDATDLGKRNGAWTEDQRILAVGKMATVERDKLCRKFDAAHANIKKGADHIERELSVPVESKATLNVAQEIRQHSKSLGGKQMDFLRERIIAGDELTVSALLGAPSYLSGMTEEAQAAFTRMWHERQNPELVQRLTLMRATIEKIQRDAPLLFREVDKAVGAGSASVQSIGAANEAAQAALRIEPTV